MKLLIAGGGTGGHLFPALAIARAVKAEQPDAAVLFVGTRRGIEARVVPESEFEIRFITARGLRGTGIVNTLRGLVELPRSWFQSWAVLREFRPSVVLGVGGYASGPTLAAAVMMGIPTAIQEQNSVMGTTNKILSRFVRRIFISWPNTEPATDPAKTVLAGNPVRNDLLRDEEPPRTSGGVNLLVFGGSRGARSINQALTGNPESLIPLAGRVRVLHQTGEGAAGEVEEAYRRAGIEADVREFIHDMGSAYHWADLVVCRAGATSLAELAALGKAALVIPYPYAIGDHQAKNASVLEAGGAVQVIPDHQLNDGALVQTITRLVDHPESLHILAANVRKFGNPHAAQSIAGELFALERSRG